MLKVWAAHGWQQQAHLPRVREWLLVEWPQDEPEPTKYWLAQLGAQSVFEKFQVGTRRFSMRRVAAISSMVSEVCTRYS
jgi:hypothetical protein